MEEYRNYKTAYIAGPRDLDRYIDAGVFLRTMGYIPINTFQGMDRYEDTDREKRLRTLEACDMVFLLEGWKEEPYSVDEYETVLEHNRTGGSIELSYPEYRG